MEPLCLKMKNIIKSNSRVRRKVENTYSGPGSTLAKRINEYGMITIGVVGSAKYGCGGMIGGLFGISIGLCDDSVPLTGLATVGAAAAVGNALQIRANK